MTDRYIHSQGKIFVEINNVNNVNNVILQTLLASTVDLNDTWTEKSYIFKTISSVMSTGEIFFLQLCWADILNLHKCMQVALYAILYS